MTSLQRSLAVIHDQIADMRRRASAPEADLLRTVPTVSAWCPAQHLDHLGRSSVSVFRRLGDTTPAKKGITLIGRLVLGIGWIPRGRGKSPERLQGVCKTGSELLAALDELEALARSVDAAVLGASRIPVVPHPKFGGLTPSQALRFVAIHNAHHLKIIDDVAGAPPAPGHPR